MKKFKEFINETLENLKLLKPTGVKFTMKEIKIKYPDKDDRIKYLNENCTGWCNTSIISYGYYFYIEKYELVENTTVGYINIFFTAYLKRDKGNFSFWNHIYDINPMSNITFELVDGPKIENKPIFTDEDPYGEENHWETPFL